MLQKSRDLAADATAQCFPVDVLGPFACYNREHVARALSLARPFSLPFFFLSFHEAQIGVPLRRPANFGDDLWATIVSLNYSGIMETKNSIAP